VGEVERIRASLGASLGSDLVTRIANLKDRQQKKHQQDDENPHHEDALELHEESVDPNAPTVVHLDVEPLNHLDLSA
jgi:hypothetical protein